MLALLSLGFLIGLSHAFEADHVAAVSSLISNQKNRLKMMRHGALWGLGHTLTLLIVAGGMMLVGGGISDRLGSGIEFAVGLMLLGLGGHVLYRLRRDRVHFHWHRHASGETHLHLHSHATEIQHSHSHPDALAGRSLAVGMMHGLAGSAALLLVAAASMKSAATGLLYIALFGLGSILGMALMSLVIAVPLAFTARAMSGLNGMLQAVIGLVTIGIGLWTMIETGPMLLG